MKVKIVPLTKAFMELHGKKKDALGLNWTDYRIYLRSKKNE